MARRSTWAAAARWRAPASCSWDAAAPVDVTDDAAADAGPPSGVVTAPSLAGNPVYAILPGAAINAAPPPATELGYTGSIPSVGAQISIGAGVPGLPAGTYTLLPGSDALLPGAFRVQLNPANHALLAGAVAIGNGSYAVNGYQGVANTAFRGALPIAVTVSSGAVVRADAQYDEETYSQFANAQAALFGSLRAPVPEDAKTLAITFPRRWHRTTAGAGSAGPVADAAGSGRLWRRRRGDHRQPAERHQHNRPGDNLAWIRGDADGGRGFGAGRRGAECAGRHDACRSARTPRYRDPW